MTYKFDVSDILDSCPTGGQFLRTCLVFIVLCFMCSLVPKSAPFCTHVFLSSMLLELLG